MYSAGGDPERARRAPRAAGRHGSVKHRSAPKEKCPSLEIEIGLEMIYYSLRNRQFLGPVKPPRGQTLRSPRPKVRFCAYPNGGAGMRPLAPNLSCLSRRAAPLFVFVATLVVYYHCYYYHHYYHYH